jgi:hypothetical protein
MAFVLPIFLTCYEIIFIMPSEENRKLFVIRLLKRQAAYYCVALIYSLPKVFAVFKSEYSGPYQLVVSASSFWGGFKFYMEALINRTDVPITLLIFMFLALCGLGILLKRRILMFSILYTCISFIPIIFLAHHRWGAYWYIPFWGVALYASNLFQIIQEKLLQSSFVKQALAFAIFIICIFTNLHFNFQREDSKAPIVQIHQENYYKEESKVSRSFFNQLVQLNLKPPKGTLIVFITPPAFYDETSLGSIAIVLYDDFTIRVQIENISQKNDKNNNALFILYTNGIVTKI